MTFQTGLAGALRVFNLDVVEYAGWQTRGSATFNPRGVVAHHTGPWSTVQAMVQMCIHGRPDLAGPLCHVVLAPDGTCHLIAAGRANHAGPGGWRNLTGNSSVFGIEAVHSGDKATPWPPEQVEAFIRCAAAMCRLAGVGAELVCAHREWAPRRKVDPVALDMDAFRRSVAGLLTQPTRPAAAAPATKGVAPMYDPPLVLEPIVASLKAPGGGEWLLAGSGAVYAFDAPFLGAPNGKGYFAGRQAAKLEPVGNAYAVIATSGERYGPDF